jgi:hypothetical protein
MAGTEGKTNTLTWISLGAGFVRVQAFSGGQVLPSLMIRSGIRGRKHSGPCLELSRACGRGSQH